MDDRPNAVSRRAALTGLGVSAGALVLGERVAAGATPSTAALPSAPVPNAVGPDGNELIGRAMIRLAAADFRTQVGAESSLTPGGLTALSPTTAMAPFAPRAGDAVSSVTVYLNPAGVARAVRVVRAQPDGTVDVLASGTSAALSIATQVRLDLPPDTVADTLGGNAYLVTVDVDAGVVVHGALVVAFSRATEFVLVEPFRVWDSRTPAGTLLVPGASAGGRIASGDTRGFTVDGFITRFATGLLLNVTLADTVGAGFLTFYAENPDDPTPPAVSSINWYTTNQIVANLVVTRMAGEADVTIRCGGGGTTHYVVDCLGYFV